MGNRWEIVRKSFGNRWEIVWKSLGNHYEHASYGSERASEFHSRYGEGSMSHDRLVLGGMCPKHAYTCFSQTNRIQQPEGRGVGGPPTETPPAGGIPGGAVVPHTRISTSRSATCFLVHRQPYNESKPSLFSKRDQGIFRAHEKSRVSGSDNVVSNGDGFRSGLPIQRSVNTRWSRHPRYHANA